MAHHPRLPSIRFLARLLLALGLLSAPARAQLLLSEYVEGSAFNQALEIYNFSQVPVDLGRFRIEIHAGGSAVPTGSVALPAVRLASRAVWVVAHPFIDPSALPAVDQTAEELVFDGDDAVVLRGPWGVADAVGEIGFDPGSQWGAGEVVTKDATLRRETYNCTTPYAGSGSFDPAVEWTAATGDDLAHLGIAPAGLQLVDCTFGSSTYRNPSLWGRVNPPAYMVTSPPLLGTTFTATIDTTGRSGAYLVGFPEPLTQPTRWGNILVDYTFPPGDFLGAIAAWSDPVVIRIDVPASPALAGFTLCTQAVRFGGGVDLTNAQDLRLGF
ncbi:MAG: hypothetical protein AB1726_15770 [Planctomycetota bacterium]